MAVFLNLFEEHLDYYGTMERYFAAKCNIARFQTPADRFFVGAQGGNVVKVVAYAEAHGVFLLQLRAPVPDHHEREEQRSHDNRHIAAVGKLRETGEEEHALDRAEDDKHQQSGDGLPADFQQVYRQQQRRHQHRDRDGKPVGGLHAAAGAEVQHHHRAADPKRGVDRADIELTLGVGGVADEHVGHEIETDRLGYQRIGAGDQSL